MRQTGDLRRHRSHYDVIIMHGEWIESPCPQTGLEFCQYCESHDGHSQNTLFADIAAGIIRYIALEFLQYFTIFSLPFWMMDNVRTVAAMNFDLICLSFPIYGQIYVWCRTTYSTNNEILDPCDTKVSCLGIIDRANLHICVWVLDIAMTQKNIIFAFNNHIAVQTPMVKSFKRIASIH